MFSLQAGLRGINALVLFLLNELVHLKAIITGPMIVGAVLVEGSSVLPAGLAKLKAAFLADLGLLHQLIVGQQRSAAGAVVNSNLHVGLACVGAKHADRSGGHCGGGWCNLKFESEEENFSNLSPKKKRYLP